MSMTIKGLQNRIPLNGVLMLVAVNAAVLVALTLVSFVTRLNGNEIYAAAWLDVPPGLAVIHRPWTVVTYMFTQTDIWHAIFNLLWLYWFGLIYQNITSPSRVVKLYVTGGLCGAVFYIAVSFIWPQSTGVGLEGASAAVMAIVTATACMIPDFKIPLFLFGPVKIKWIAIATIMFFAIGLTGSNAGAHIAHLGGVVLGVMWVLIPRLRCRRTGTTKHRYVGTEADARAELDRLLDKVRRSGYGALTADERRRLVELSKRV